MRVAAVSEPEVGGEGLVFNLQRCSIHDGPGIRTTVFLKGCPLSCDWCHNPEGIDQRPELMLNADRCLECGACTEACPVARGGAGPVSGSGDGTACLRCGSCVKVCPAEARELAGRSYGVDELADLVERDRPFFESSGGGVTFSGGEPLGQPRFLMACLLACRERGLHTAVDTCGLAPREELLEVARLADLVLFDLKHVDSDIHRKYTGADNRLILDNLKILSAGETEIWVRVPLIPGVNDETAHLDAIGSFLAALPRGHRVFLLPYHPIAESKTARLGGTRTFTPYAAPDAEALGAARSRLEVFGLDVETGVSS